jgi:hypothetical protein
MGAKHLFHFLRERYPTAFRTITFPPKRGDPVVRSLPQAVHREGALDSDGHFASRFHGQVIPTLNDIVKAVCQTRLIYISEDGDTPFAKVDESRRRVLRRLQQGKDNTPTFLENSPDDPDSATAV